MAPTPCSPCLSELPRLVRRSLGARDEEVYIIPTNRTIIYAGVGVGALVFFVLCFVIRCFCMARRMRRQVKDANDADAARTAVDGPDETMEMSNLPQYPQAAGQRGAPISFGQRWSYNSEQTLPAYSEEGEKFDEQRHNGPNIAVSAVPDDHRPPGFYADDRGRASTESVATNTSDYQPLLSGATPIDMSRTQDLDSTRPLYSLSDNPQLYDDPRAPHYDDEHHRYGGDRIV
ncbi:uncharacterized protein V1518DRAFT_418761 [Limtongia smithiae]|uniref:uncharacterized protein n=1 Tax=Limtongia smithiae TaxID=1125753 RepID=UPI0034CDF83F